ncbi:MAG: hypothetical protein IPJ81_12660 [Chitinophagaceae bacterium]|nr:hypothetical protein [Chitinophagaceae bacterium]
MSKNNYTSPGDLTFKEILILIPIAIIIVLLCNYNSDFILLFILLLICFGIYIISSKTKFKQLLRLLALFLLLHLIIFPVIYIALLKYDSDSFEFDKGVLNSEKNNSLVEINSKYVPIDLENNIKLIDKILLIDSSKLNLPFEILHDGNLLLVKNYIFGLQLTHGIPPQMFTTVFSIYDSTGKFISMLNENDDNNSLNFNGSIHDFINKKKNDYQTKLANCNKDIRRVIEKEDIWSYRRIISYSINIFLLEI